MRQPARAGFTLVELLVVLAIVSVLMTLTAIYVVPAFSDNKNVVRGLDRVVTMLLIAKQRALRDGRPVGVRFDLETDADPVDSTYTRTKCLRLRYVEQPDVVSGWQATLATSNPTALLNDVDLFGGGGPTGTNDANDFVAQPDDWLRVSGQNYQITSITAQNTLTIRNPPTTTTVNGRWQIYRLPRPIGGEDVVELPQNVAIDFGGVALAYSANQVPSRPNVTNTATINEIVFAPNGSVINAPGSAGILLWVRDESKSWVVRVPDPNDPKKTVWATPDYNTARVAGVSPQSGLISTHEINPPPGDPLAFALDGKASGL